ncbi:OmpA family protein [Aridibaculum aurantiacum]|uniref:OmpA family protein n=1 Tax=Aridibaculum aurantiacum TaxID=2810307 RepID=UPI001A95A11C|nr:OmpA family protein [Aridibaculum aurantiacum]
MRVLLVCILLIPVMVARAQNLVANGSFEDRNVCTEYNAACAPEGWFFIPRYVDMSPVKHKNHFESVSFGNLIRGHYIRNYIYTKMLCTLQPGKQYRLSMSVQVPKNPFQYLHVWLGNEEPGKPGKEKVVYEPAFTILPDSIHRTRKKWHQLSYTFTANGGERFIMLGNFSKKPLDRTVLEFGNNRGDVLYNLDNISLAAVEPTTNGCEEYAAVLRQVYEQNHRHPARLIDPVKADTAVSKVFDLEPTIQPEPALPAFDTLVVPDLLFDFNSSRLNPAFRKVMDSIVNVMRKKRFSAIQVVGHTDNIGSEEYNRRLSIDRAITIKGFLVQEKFSAGLISISGRGKSEPVATNDTPEGRQRNRRVEIILER